VSYPSNTTNALTVVVFPRIMWPLRRQALLLVEMVLLMCAAWTNGGTVKIAEGVDKLSTDSLTTYAATTSDSGDLLPTASPDPITGPASLHFLAAQCFTADFERWEYIVCPFHNITQRRVLGHKTNLVGVWGHWKPSYLPESLSTGNPLVGMPSEVDAATTESSNSTSVHSNSINNKKAFYNFMHFEEGRSCADDVDSGSGPFMTATVQIVCNHTGTAVQVLSVDDSMFCSYSFKLGVPIACNLLTPDEGDVFKQQLRPHSELTPVTSS
jgi:hypothetical protein